MFQKIFFFHGHPLNKTISKILASNCFKTIKNVDRKMLMEKFFSNGPPFGPMVTP